MEFVGLRKFGVLYKRSNQFASGNVCVLDKRLSSRNPTAVWTYVFLFLFNQPIVELICIFDHNKVDCISF